MKLIHLIFDTCKTREELWMHLLPYQPLVLIHTGGRGTAGLRGEPGVNVQGPTGMKGFPGITHHCMY